MTIQFHTSDKGMTAYKQNTGDAPTSIFFLSGWRTTFDNRKRDFLEQLCDDHAISLTHFTYFGWDQSHSDELPTDGDGFVQHWLDQALDLFDAVTTGPQLVIGSSMGGYLALALTHARAKRVAGLIGIAAGFGPDLVKCIKDSYGEYRVGTKIENGFKFSPETDGSLLIADTLNIHCPVHLIHSLADETVHYRNTLHIADAVVSDDVTIHLTKAGGHRANRPEDSAWLENTILDLIES